MRAGIKLLVWLILLTVAGWTVCGMEQSTSMAQTDLFVRANKVILRDLINGGKPMNGNILEKNHWLKGANEQVICQMSREIAGLGVELGKTLCIGSGAAVFLALKRGTKYALKLGMVGQKHVGREYRFLKKIDSEYVIKVFEYKQLEGIQLKIRNRVFGPEREMQQHPNTPCIEILLLEYLPGKDLFDFAFSGVEKEQYLTIWAQVARALQDTHDKGIIHRDIKPENIMISPQGHAKLIDYGLAALINSRSRTPVGTPAYAEPGQISGADIFPRGPENDWYSLGIVILWIESGFEAPPVEWDELVRTRDDREERLSMVRKKTERHVGDPEIKETIFQLCHLSEVQIRCFEDFAKSPMMKNFEWSKLDGHNKRKKVYSAPNESDEPARTTNRLRSFGTRNSW